VVPIYTTALAVGGTLLLASLLLGHHGADHAGGLGHGHDTAHGGNHGSETEAPVGVLVNLISIRFWTFALAFFGLTGVLFEGLDIGHGTHVLVMAIGIGFTVGYIASWLVRKLRSEVVTSVSTELSFVGLTGEVLLDVSKEEPGRIRITARGSLVDLPARTESARLERGARALVLDVQDGVASVSRAQETQPPQTKEEGRNT
jgi:hypothetical protein